ncbi:MAG: hypothetical protein AAGA92_02785 [Planctomycetota bacterium]
MPGDEIRIQIEPKPRHTARPRKRKAPLWTAGLIGLLLVVVVALGVVWTLGPADAPMVEPEQAEEAVPAPLVAEEAVAESQETEKPHTVADDGSTLWVSPTAGKPIGLSYTPPGARLFVHLRPAALAGHGEGEKLFAALGPWGQTLANRLQSELGPDWQTIDQLLLTITSGLDGRLRYTFRAERERGWDESPSTRARQVAEEVLLAGDADSVEVALQTGDAPPMLPREIAGLIQTTDADRALTIVAPTRLLDASASQLFSGVGAPLPEAASWLLGDDARAFSVSCDLSDNLFIELRADVALNARPHRYAAGLQRRLGEAAAAVERRLADSETPAYSRRVLLRWPAMLRFADRQARYGVERRQAIARWYLPVAAAHNLAFAAELFLHRDLMAGNEPGSMAQPSADSIEAKLNRPISLVFAQETLEYSLQLLGDDLRVPIRILGGDLQLEGITKNQSFGIDLRDQPAGEVLVEILRLANPDKTATGPTDPRQKLVYTVRDTPGEIVVTTRRAAAKRGETLPAVFGSGTQ